MQHDYTFNALLETVKWCERLLKTQVAQAPQILWSLGARNSMDLNILSPHELQAFSNKVVEARKQRLIEINAPDIAPDALSEFGNILAFFPQQTTGDGVPEAVTQGYFDHFGFAPLDTWITLISLKSNYHINDCLLSWVPNHFYDDVDQAINYCSDDSLIWYNQLIHHNHNLYNHIARLINYN